MTNREMLLHTLQDDDYFDDGGATDEANIFYYVGCPCGMSENSLLRRQTNSKSMKRRMELMNER